VGGETFWARSKELAVPFTIKTLNAFEMTSRTAAAEIPAKRESHKAFVAVYPPSQEQQLSQWRIRRFEIPVKFIGACVGEEELIDSQFVRLDDIEEVETLLSSWGIDSGTLDAPWKCDYPL
jgi:hypothetical protein